MRFRTTGTYAVLVIAGAMTLALVCCRSAAVESVYPAARLRDGFRRHVWSRVAGAWNGAASAAENVRLRREIAELSMLPGELERLERENARLRASLGYAERQPGAWLAAPVLSRSLGAYASEHEILVGRG